MKTQHTPGPWQLYYLPFMDSDNGIDLKGNNGNTLIANFPTPIRQEGVAYVPSEEDAANLRLIAAAPELLETLQDELHALELWRAISNLPADLEEGIGISIDKARTAIAKATE